jgi:hypothetical protein
MKFKNYFLLAFFVANFSTFSQNFAVGHLTIFSENGDKFKLILNGELQNDIAQTNLRVEDLNQQYYNAKIQFEDNSLLEISKNNLRIANYNGVFQDVTYKIKRDLNNKSKMKMDFFSMVPVIQGNVIPENIYVVHHGAPRQNGLYNQTTTTTASVNQGVNVGANINLGGVNMNVNINDPYGNQVTQTSTTTSYQHSNTSNQSSHNEPTYSGCANKFCMSPRDFTSAIASIKKQGFDDTKLKIAKQIASSNCLNTNQIFQICQTFGFEANKLDFAKYAYDFCIEQKKYYELNSMFSFSSSVDSLTDYIKSKR